MTQAGLSDVVAAAVADLVRRDATPFPDPLPTVDLERCRSPERGDYSTAVALRLAVLVDVPARELAARLADALVLHPTVRAAGVSGPGFVNVAVRRRPPAEVLTEIVAAAGPVRPAEPAVPGSVGGPADLRALRRAVVSAAVARLQDSAGVRAGEGRHAPDRVGVVRVLPPAGAPSPAAAEGSLADVDPVVLRFELLRHPVSMPLTLHPEVLSRDAVVNPGYAVRHAADRCRRLLVNAADLGVDPDRGAVGSDALESPDAARLVAALSSYDEVVRAAATRSEPHRLVRHLEETADAVLALTAGTAVLPRGDEEGDDRHRALLLAVRAGGVVLRGGLSLLGLPEGPR